MSDALLDAERNVVMAIADAQEKKILGSYDATAEDRYADLTDYHNFVKRDTPKHERRLLGVGDIWSNMVRCRTCGELVRSRHRHDFRWCKCGTVAVDGGSWYSKRSVKEEADFEEMTELFDDVEV